jgi:sulfatase maturation enzyme AslB (radical SAM superfamily)
MGEEDAIFIVDEFKKYFKNITYYSWLREPDFTSDYKNRWIMDNKLSTIKPIRFELASFYRIVRDKEYVKFLKEVGTNVVQLTFFGLKNLTDKYVGRIGAFEELIEATEILKANAIEPRWQIFINEENKDEIIKVIQLGEEMKVNKIFVHEGSCDGNNF